LSTRRPVSRTAVLQYPAKLEPDENKTVLITFPDLPGAISFGDDEEDALRHGADALLTVISALIDDWRVIPAPSAPRPGQRLVSLSSLAATKLAIYTEMRGQGVTKAEMARRLKQDPKQVDRLLDVLHASRHDQLDRALAALGKRIEIIVRDAA
jgi:antitoxin HicB